MKSVKLPKGLKEIGKCAFDGCKSLKSVTIPSSVTSIGNMALSGCDKLKSIQVDKNNPKYKSMDGILFTKDGKTLIRCPGGYSGAYSIPSSVTKINDGAFARCSSLKSVTILSGVTKIGKGSFSQCSSLKIVRLPKSLKTIGEDAFYSCYALDTVCYAGTEAQWKKVSIEEDDYCLTKAEIYYNYVIPAAPTATGSHSEKGKPVVSWEAVKGAEKYQVWRSATGEEGSFKRVSTTTKLEFTNGKAVTGETYYYKVRGVTELGETGEFSKVVKLTAKETKPAIKTQPKSVTAAAGETAVFTVKATGKDLTYQWQYRSSPDGKWYNAKAEGNQTATLQVPVTAKKNGWEYRCVIKNAGGKVTTEIVTLTVK